MYSKTKLVAKVVGEGIAKAILMFVFAAIIYTLLQNIVLYIEPFYVDVFAGNVADGFLTSFALVNGGGLFILGCFSWMRGRRAVAA